MTWYQLQSVYSPYFTLKLSSNKIAIFDRKTVVLPEIENYLISVLRSNNYWEDLEKFNKNAMQNVNQSWIIEAVLNERHTLYDQKDPFKYIILHTIQLRKVIMNNLVWISDSVRNQV